MKFHKVLLFILFFNASYQKLFSQCITYTVRACIDGSDELHIQNNQMWWNHLTHTPPGQHANCSPVLSVNNVNWNPWNAPFNLPSSVQCYSLSSVNVISCRNICNLVQSPSASNGWETIYLLDDNAPGGATVYEIAFTFCPTFTLTTSSTSVSCNGGNNGTANVIATGSNGYTYTWAPTGGNSSTATNLTAGIYTIQVKDGNNCIFTKTVNVTQPNPLNIVSVSTKSAQCYGQASGSATVNVNGGTAPYSYTWQPSPGATTSNTVNNLSAGNYTISVSDSHLCPSVSTTFNINQPPDITISITPTDVACYQGSDGAALGNAQGGAGFFNWAWTDGTNTISVNPYVGSLSAGDYTLVVTDINGCVKTASIDIGEPPPLNILIVSTQS
ncbi:MAG: SprB repeat-containing protein, partial [Bacteroidia bacterium]|nr:SprB repeat-containing protein [Bacteroidia bacterium]